ncbi:MAG: hypothetical protein ACYDHM_15320 [Acidiferrobacterales bacterium]
MATFLKRPGPKGKPAWQTQIIQVGERPKFRTFGTKGAAIEWAGGIESAMDRDEWVNRAEGNRTTLCAAPERYEREILPGKAASGQDSEGRRINRLQGRPIARTALTRLGGVEVADYIRGREA